MTFTASDTLYWYDSAALSDVGAVRSLNEDSCLERPDIGLWVVADGMGGHDAGDQASRAIVQSLDGIAGPIGAAPLLASVRHQLHAVNDALRLETQQRGLRRGMGSTVVVLLARGEHYCCLWAGDSRIYRLRNGFLTQLTRDHSYVQELVDRGLLTPREARDHPQANIITRAVGTEDDLQLDKVHDRTHPHDVFLLCSDGLTRELTDPEIAEILSRDDPPRAVRSLISAAIERGAGDNVTAVAVRLRPTAGF